MFDAALPGILHSHSANNLGREIARGIKALWFFLEVDTLQVQRFDAINSFVIRLARHPAERFVIPAVGQHDIAIFPGNAGDQRYRGRQILYFRRYCECRIHKDRHCEFFSSPVVNDAALGRKWNLALLLVFRLLNESAVMEDLQINQAAADGHAPEQEHSAKNVYAGVLAGVGVSSHDNSNGLSFRQYAKRRGGTCFLLMQANSRLFVALAPRNDNSWGSPSPQTNMAAYRQAAAKI